MTIDYWQWSSPLVTNADVQAVVGTSADCYIYIVTADMIVQEQLATGKCNLSQDRLKAIETYLAAHFAVLTLEGGGLKSEKMGDSEDQWETKMLGPGLNATRFGQTAMVLDTCGKLRAMGSTTLSAQFRMIRERKSRLPLGYPGYVDGYFQGQ